MRPVLLRMLGVGLVAKVDVNQYIKWAAEKPTRSVKIEVENRNEIKVWVYDQEIGTGMYAVIYGRTIPADQIDLLAYREEGEKRQYEALKRKFEGGNS